MALTIGSTCAQPTLTAVSACQPYRTLKIKKFLLINGTITAAEAANLFPVGLGGVATAPTIVTGLNTLVANSKLSGSPTIGGFTIAAPSVTTLTDVDACKPVDIVTGQEATFKSSQASTAAAPVFTTGLGATNAFIEWDYWYKVSGTSGCWSGAVMLVDCDLNLYYLLTNRFKCAPATGAAAFADTTITATMTVDPATGVVTWEGKLSNTTGFTLQPILNLTSTGIAANAVLI